MEASITTDMFDYSFKPGREKKLRLFAEYGFRYIHWCDDWDNDTLYSKQTMMEHKRLIETVGLDCLDVHGVASQTHRIDAEDPEARDTYVRLLENRIEFCRVVGGDAVVIHPPRLDREGHGRRLELSQEVLDGVMPLCEESGVVIAMENVYPGNERVLEYFFERYPPSFLAFCFDSGHANVNGNTDPLFGFRDRLRVLHLHDNKGESDDHQPPFWGTLDWGRIMGWIKESGYRKPINFEVIHKPMHFKGTMGGFLTQTVESAQRTLALL